MDIQKLYYFFSVAKHLNFTKAANECHMAQTAMSRYIANLESELGFPLFIRDHHNVSLTPAGEYFLEQAKVVVNTYSRAQSVGIDISQSFSESLTIGFGGYETDFVKKYSADFAASHPRCSIVLYEFSYDSIVEALFMHQCDIIFCPGNRLEKLSNIRALSISRSPYSALLSRKSPLAEYNCLQPEMLDGKTFICASDKNHSWEQVQSFSSLCRTYGFSPGKIIHTNTPSAAVAMAEMNMGICVVSENMSNFNLRTLKNIPIIPPPGTQIFKNHMVASESGSKKSIVATFMDYMEDVLQSQIR